MIRDRLRRLWRWFTRADPRDEAKAAASDARANLMQARARQAQPRRGSAPTGSDPLMDYIDDVLGGP